MGRPTRFSEDEKRKVFRLYKEGVTQKDIAERFGCSQVYISKVIKEQGSLDG